MPFIVVGHVAAGSTDTNSVTTGALDTSGANLLVLVLGQESGVATSVITDSKSNTWNPLTTQTEGAGQCTIYWSVPTSVGSGHTFTATQAGASPAIVVGAYSGATPAPFDQQNGDHSSTGATLATGSVTPTFSSELIVAGASGRTGSGAIVSIDGGFTIAGNTSPDAFHDSAALAYLIQGPSVAANPTWTFTNAASVKTAVIATFQAKATSMLVVF